MRGESQQALACVRARIKWWFEAFRNCYSENADRYVGALPMNNMKQAMADKRQTFGLWLALASPGVGVIASNAGFDWVLVDCEHGPYDLTRLETQLMALHGHPADVVVRVPIAQDWVLKQALDLGAQTVMIPMINTVADAKAAVAACKYPPQGMRGMGAALARASLYNHNPNYTSTANDDICVILQLETQQALENLEDIAAIPGIDALFIGPTDLGADMGYPGQVGVPQVVDAVDDGIRRIHAAGLASGLIAFDAQGQKKYADLGVSFIGVGSDTTLMQTACCDLAARLGR